MQVFTCMIIRTFGKLFFALIYDICVSQLKHWPLLKYTVFFSAATRGITANLSNVANGVEYNKDGNTGDPSKTDSESITVFNEELLAFHVKQFVAECVQKFIVGMPSYSLSQLIMYFVSLLNPNVSKDLKDKKGNAGIDELCKKV